VYTVSPTADISYSVIGTYTDTGCSSMAFLSLSVSDCSGISELEANALQIFPNPTDGCFYVNAADATISIYNSAGELVSAFEHHWSHDDCFPGLSPGIYYLVISGYNQVLRLVVVD